MKKLAFILFSLTALASWSLSAEIIPVTKNSTVFKKQEDFSVDEKLISFRFNQAPLIEIINMLAEEKGLNIVIPAGQQSIAEKVTFEMPEKITVGEAWERLLSFLRICGYSVIFQREFVTIIKNDPKDTSRQPFPLYVQTSTSVIPNTDEKIRYLYYFYNMQLSGDSNSGSVIDILQAFLSKDATILPLDDGSNGIVITDGARHIASTINLLKELDERMLGNEGREVVKLKHTVATTIAAYLQSIINPSGKQMAGDIGAPAMSQYFSKNIRIVPEPRTNSLILLGKKEPLARIKLFIEEFIDIKLDSGESILHIYDLQYLDAATFKQTLSSILASQGAASSQSSGSTANSSGQQYFKDVKIVAESTQAVNPATLASVSSGNVSANNQAGNRLIIAAKRDDWLRIEKLIKDLDKPQLQVAIEVLIVDLTVAEDKILGAQLRNLSSLSIGSANFQTSHLGGNANGVFIEAPAINSTSGDQLKSDLLQKTGNNSAGNQENMASGFTAGSFILSFKDPATNGMWLITQMLNTYQDAKILSQPFIVTLNNQPGSFSTVQSKLLAGGSSVIPGGGGVQSYKENVKATLGVKLTPMISRDMRINLAIDVSIQEYQDTNSTVILNRAIHTNVNIRDGEILVLGGLTKTTLTKSERSTPILSRIPVVGNLFKSKDNAKSKDNLLVFISPRIIMPRKEGIFDAYTASKISNVNKMFDNNNMESLKDPITHWFFGSDQDELAVKKVKMLGKKDLFDQDIDLENERSSKIIIVNKNEQLSPSDIKESVSLIPSPDKTELDKTATGLPKLIVQAPPKINNVKKETDEVLNEAILMEELNNQQNESSQKKIIERTKTGIPKIIVKHPENIIREKKEEESNNNFEYLNKEDANLKKLASQLKPIN